MKRNSIAWKLNVVFIAIIVTVIAALSYFGNAGQEREAVATARSMSQFHLESILLSIERLMMVRDLEGIREMIDAAAEHDPLCRDIRMMSHAGAVVASTRPAPATLHQEDWPCSSCHSLDDPRQGLVASSHDRVVKLAPGERGVSVMTAVLNEPNCSSTGCHPGSEAQPVLGLLQAEFSLSEVDNYIARRNLSALLAVLVAVTVSIGATWLTMEQLLGRRMRMLRAGMQEVANGELRVRFGDFGDDEVGELAGAFDYMSGELQSTLKELRSTSDYLWGIVENSADIIITVDPSGAIMTFNSGAERSLGYQRDEVVGKEIEMLFADPSERSYAIAKLDDSDNVTNFETHFLTKHGEVRDVILTLSRLRSRKGEPIGTFGISKDVTRENRLLRELILNEKLAAIGQAVTGIQHSIKNMLSSLKGGVYMVETGVSENDRKLLEEGWAMVKDGIDHITALSSRMLHYVRDWQPELEETDIGELVTSVYDGTLEMARSKGIAYQLEVEPRLPKIVCDPRLVRLALMDLVSNAFDACIWKDYEEPERPEVTLRTRGADGRAGDQRGDCIEICVDDNGEGISEGIKKNLFTPFFSTKKRLGTGMGLALTSRVIRRHGGTIEVDSELGRGTTFTVSLPVGCSPEQEKVRDGQESPDHR